jgi:uncharacterized protein
MGNYRRSIYGAAACLASLLAAPLAPLAAQQAAPVPPRTLTVSAMGSIDREPEQGVITLAVESEAPTARAAADANAARMTQLLAALRRAGVPERQIRTVSYELRPEYARPDPTAPGRAPAPPRIAGYRAINMVEVTVDTVARMGGIIDVAIESGANRVSNIRFQLRDAHAAHLEAVALAMRNARREAEVVAAAADQRLGPPLNISTGGFAGPPAPMQYARADMMEMAQATSIEPGTLRVQAHVNVVYQLIAP